MHHYDSQEYRASFNSNSLLNISTSRTLSNRWLRHGTNLLEYTIISYSQLPCLNPYDARRVLLCQIWMVNDIGLLII